MKKQYILAIILSIIVLLGCNLTSDNGNENDVATSIALGIALTQTSDAELQMAVEETIQASISQESEEKTDSPGGFSIPSIRTPIPLPITNTPVIITPDITITPSFTPSHTSTVNNDLFVGEPSVDFLFIYFGALLRDDYHSAWNNLTPDFKQRMHGNQFSDYVDGYEDMRLCDVQISDPTIVSKTSTIAKIAAHFVYKTGSSCSASSYDFVAKFIFDPNQNRWLLDGFSYQE